MLEFSGAVPCSVNSGCHWERPDEIKLLSIPWACVGSCECLFALDFRLFFTTCGSISDFIGWLIEYAFLMSFDSSKFYTITNSAWLTLESSPIFGTLNSLFKGRVLNFSFGTTLKLEDIGCLFLLCEILLELCIIKIVNLKIKHYLQSAFVLQDLE